MVGSGSMDCLRMALRLQTRWRSMASEAALASRAAIASTIMRWVLKVSLRSRRLVRLTKREIAFWMIGSKFGTTIFPLLSANLTWSAISASI